MKNFNGTDYSICFKINIHEMSMTHKLVAETNDDVRITYDQ